MKKLIYLFTIISFVFSMDILSGLFKVDVNLFEDKNIILFESLILKKENIGEENYNALYRLLNSPTIAKKSIISVLK
jgi:hypothetical protein